MVAAFLSDCSSAIRSTMTTLLRISGAVVGASIGVIVDISFSIKVISALFVEQ